MPKYSIIIPVFNRPDEIDELLASLTKQSFHDFEVILVEDGSSRHVKPLQGIMQISSTSGIFLKKMKARVMREIMAIKEQKERF